MPRFNRTFTAGIALFAVAGLMACASGDSSGPKYSVVGTYSLATVNGTSIPATVVNQGVTIKVNSGTLAINSGNTFSSVFNYTITQQGQMVTFVDTCTGTYTQNGNSFSFAEATSSNPNCGGTVTGSWDGVNTVTVALDASLQLVFKR